MFIKGLLDLYYAVIHTIKYINCMTVIQMKLPTKGSAGSTNV